MLPLGEWKQMWWSKGVAKHTVCFALQYSAPSPGSGSHCGESTIGGQGPLNAKHVHCCVSLKKSSFPKPKCPIEPQPLDSVWRNHSSWKFRFSVLLPFSFCVRRWSEVRQKYQRQGQQQLPNWDVILCSVLFTSLHNISPSCYRLLFLLTVELQAFCECHSIFRSFFCAWIQTASLVAWIGDTGMG